MSPPCGLLVSWPFGYPPGYAGTATGWHPGRDYPCPVGTPLRAVADATVAVMESGPSGVVSVLDGAWGVYLRLALADGTSRVYDYCHLSAYAAGLTEGDRVRRGDVVAYSGQSGLPGVTIWGPHLHEQGWLDLAACGDGRNRVDTAPWFGSA